MAIESSLSPLASDELLERLEDPLDSEEREEEVEERTPAAKPSHGSIYDNLIAQIGDINLARYMTDSDLDQIGMMVVDEYRIDETSRKDWEDKAEKALKFAMQETQPKVYPWPGSSSLIFPLITQATTEFAARTYPAIVQGRNVVKGVVWGDDKGEVATQDGEPDGPPIVDNGQPVWKVAPGAKRLRADRIGEHMSWQLLEQMPEWEPQTDQLLHQIPVVGGAAKKTYFDPELDRPRSPFVSLLNLVWNYHADSFEVAPRHTEKVLLYPYQITDKERTYDEGSEEDGGMFLPLNYGSGGGAEGDTYDGKPVYSGDMSDSQAPHLFIEQHRRLDLDCDGYPEPYIVTVHLRSSKVVRIVARYTEDGIKASKDGETVYKIDADDMYTLYSFLPSIDGGSYPIGFGHLLRPLNSALNTSLNQMFDAGTLANTGGGFISDQLGMPSGQTLFGTGKFHRVTTKGMDIRQAVYPIDWKGPNVVLFQLFGALATAAKEMAGIGNILAGDAAIANAPPTTVLALIEQGMNFYTAIVKRIFRAAKQEYAKLYKINRANIHDVVEFQRGDQLMLIRPEDYQLGGGVEPVADPTMVTNMQKLGRAQVIVGAAEQTPNMDKDKVALRLLEAANIEQPEDLFAPPNPMAQQMAMQAQQLAMAMQQAQLGAERAKELKDQTQAFLNMALARKNANAGEEAWIDAQLTYLRLQVEAVNAQTRAGQVDHAFHATNIQHTRDMTQMALDQAENERQRQHEAQQAQLQPGPTGAFPEAPSAPVGPDVTTASSLGTGNPNVPGGPSGPGNPATGGM